MKTILEEVRDLLLKRLSREETNLTWRNGYERGVRDFYKTVSESGPKSTVEKLLPYKNKKDEEI